MKSAVAIRQLRELYHREPFEPFELVFNNGERLRVDDPARIAFDPTMTDEDDAWPQVVIATKSSFVMKNLEEVTRIAPVQAQPASS